MLAGTHWDGRDRCDAPISPPKKTAILPSPPPRDSLSKAYKKLAEKAEELVPKTWWRDGFANDLLLLSHNDKEGPSGSLISTQKFVIRNCETSTSKRRGRSSSASPSFEEIVTPRDHNEARDAEEPLNGRSCASKETIAGQEG